MAVNSYSISKLKADSLSFVPIPYRRKDKKIKTKKFYKKIKLKSKHIVLLFILLIGFFYFLQQFCIFLISWNKLNIESTEFFTENKNIKNDIQSFLKDKKLGNILLLDIDNLQESLSRHHLIKEVRVRKVFPSSLKIYIEERIPFAILKKENLFLIDEGGVILKKFDVNKKEDYPLLIDSNNFKRDYNEKLKLAWRCLNSLGPSLKENIEVLDLSDYGNVSIKLKEFPTWIICGNNKFADKLRFFQNYQTRLNRYGPLEYIDLRFNDLFFIKTYKKTEKNNPLYSSREGK